MKPNPWKWDEGLNAYALTCDSTADFLSADEYAYGQDHRERHSRTGSFEFTCTHGYDDAVKLLGDGWPEGAQQASKLQAKLAYAMAAADTTSERFHTTWDVCGEEPDIGRYLTGEPENMMDYRLEEVPAFGRVASIVVNGAVSAGIDESHLREIAVMLAALVDSIENTGIRCEMVVRYREGRVCEHRSKDCELEHWIKRASQPLDLPKVAAACHPSAFRRIVFRWFECLRGIDGAYGRPSTSQRPFEPGSVAVDMSELKRFVGDEAAILKWIEEQRTRLIAGEGIPA